MMIKEKVYKFDPETKVSDKIDEFCGWQLNLNKNSLDKILEKKRLEKENG